jgi:hypothetical protein
MTTQNAVQETKRINLDIPENNLGLKEVRVFEGTHIQVSLNFQVGNKNLIIMGFANPTNPEMPGAENEPPYFFSLARVRRNVDGQLMNVSTARIQQNQSRRALNALFSNAYLAAKGENIPAFEVPEVHKLENRSLPANDLGIVSIVAHQHVAPTGQKKVTGQAWPCTLIFENHLQVEVVLRPASNRPGYYLDYYRRPRKTTNARGWDTADNVYWLAKSPEMTAINNAIINLVSGIIFGTAAVARPAAQVPQQQILPEMEVPLVTVDPHQPQVYTGHEDNFPF